jgi:hypothetical protein
MYSKNLSMYYKYSKNLPMNPNANSTRKLRYYEHPASLAPAPLVAGMASTSGRDQVNYTPVAPIPPTVPALVPSIPPAQVSVPAPALSSPSAHVISTTQFMAAEEPSHQTSSDLRYRWLLDSGASVHISNNLSHFATLDTNPALFPPVTYGDGESTKSSEFGTMRIKGD